MPLTEFEIIDKYFRHLTGKNSQVAVDIGDDAAVINIPKGKQLVTSVDTLVSGIHFFADADPYVIGYKSLAVNISDLAAMGAQPYWATLALTLPEEIPAWIEKFAAGFSSLARQYDVSLIGGDLTHGPLSITVHIMGMVENDKAITRSGAAAGDGIYVSGCLGAAGLALLYLNKDEHGKTIKPSQSCVDRLLQPEPRVNLGRALIDLASAAIDISDGLAADLGHILEASGKGAAVILDNVPLCDELLQLKDRGQRLQIALCSGDDYELCFTASEKDHNRIEQISNELGIPLNHIGLITDDQSIKWLNTDGSSYKLVATGYRHF